MPVDRFRRDAIADRLASFLRSEISRETLEVELRRFDQADDAEEMSSWKNDIYLEGLLGFGLYHIRTHRPISDETWVELCRHLAFLKTDYEDMRCHDDSYDEDRPWQILLARWHVVGLLVAFGLAYLTSWWIVSVAIPISFLLYQVALWKHDASAREERKRQAKQRLEYYPFADESEWLAHRPLVDQYQLPAYNADAFDLPPPTSTWHSIIITPIRWACYPLVVVGFLYLYLFIIVFWPLWLVPMSLCRRGTCQQQAAS